MMNRRSLVRAVAALAALPALALSSIKAKAVPAKVIVEKLTIPQLNGLEMHFSDLHYFLKKLHEEYKHEPNDAITRKSLIDRATELMNWSWVAQDITEYKIVCDDTNNPPSVLASGGLGLSVMWKPRVFHGTDSVAHVHFV